MRCARSRRFGSAIAVVGFSFALIVGVSAGPGAALPAKLDDRPSSQTVKSTNGRVVPLPTGKYTWGAGFGVAGSMWSSGYHTGQDLGASAGTAVLAAAEGVVVFTGNGGPYGNLTQVQHSDGVQTWYAHQSLIIAKVGQHVKPGQVIGAVGATGNTTGPHLHLEVRVGGASTDPRPWLAGAAAVAATGAAGVVFDAVIADELRGKLREAEDKQAQAQREATEIGKRVALVNKQLVGAQRKADRARKVLARYAREVYKTGVEPAFLLQAEALSSGDPAQFTDREVLLKFSHESQNALVARALAAMAKALELREEVAALEAKARTALDAANQQLAVIETQLEAGGGVGAFGSQFDGVIPAGGSPRALRAVKFALAQVGSRYSPSGGTGPEYGCNGFTWRAWDEGGYEWPLQMANDQALNQEWTVPIPLGQEKPGDLVFFRLNNGTDLPGRIDHVGVVVNPAKGIFVHASSPRTGVELNNYKSSSSYSRPAGFGRMIASPADPKSSPGGKHSSVGAQNSRESGSSKPRRAS